MTNLHRSLVVTVLFLSGTANAQTNPINIASENFSSCLMAAVDNERTKPNPSVEQVKAACRDEIDTLYDLLGDAVASLPSLDQRLQEELNQ